LQCTPESEQEVVAWIGPDVDSEAVGTADRPHFSDNSKALEWFCAVCGLTDRDCLVVPLDVGRSIPALIALGAPSRDGFTHHQQHLIGTMGREVARFLQLALAHIDLEEQRRQVEQLRSDFVATVSHELRTPLALIQASVDSLTHLSLADDQKDRCIEDIGESTRRLAHIVDTVLTLSRVEAGDWAVQVTAADLAAIVARASRECGPEAQMRLEVDVPPIDVLIDPERMVQVVSNLVTNALKYSADRSPIRVRARAWLTHGFAWLEVRDWGQGIPEEDRPHLFERFFRASNVRQSPLAGTGLGLYISKRLVEAQGGSIRLWSRSGEGTAIRICLPLAPREVPTGLCGVSGAN
jgi:signal transduction histidine kinase